VPHESVTVVHSDTGVVRSGGGTMASRSAQVGGSAVLRASEAVVEKARRLAAHLLESDPHDIQLLDDGRVGVAGAPDRSFSWAELALLAGRDANRPEGMEPGLAEAADFSQPYDGTYAFGAHVVVVEVDSETGLVVIRQHVAVDDAGRILNPLLADGQVHGGAAQGVAQALFEEVRYDDGGTPLTASLTAYGVPTAADLCRVDRIVLETPTPNNPLGAKGIGEAATIGSTPAVHNAVVDAVAHLGIRHLDMPLTPERVWRAIRAAMDPAVSARGP
jgi:aerobic carbon-monoxide dehydrogenase large subunit